jgi:hypothetical protein
MDRKDGQEMFQDKQLVGIRIAELTHEAEVGRLARRNTPATRPASRWSLTWLIAHGRRVQVGI